MAASDSGSYDPALLLLDAAPLQMWTARPDGALDFVNVRVAEYFGRGREQMIGEGWKNVVHSSDLKLVVEAWSTSVRTGAPYRVEFRLLQASTGLYRWHLGHALPVRDDQGAVLRWLGTNTDIDGHKRALEVRDAAVAVAKRERERLRQVILYAPAVMALYHGPRYEVTIVNRAWEEFTGRRNAVGRTARELFPEVTEQGIFDILDEVYRTGTPFHTDERRIELRQGEGGELEERCWSFSIQRIDASQGEDHDLLIHAVEVKK